MGCFEEDLFKTIGIIDYNLAGFNNFRIHPGSDHYFYSAFEQEGFEVVLDSDNQKANLGFKYPHLEGYKRVIDFYTSEITYEQLRKPVEKSLANSLRTYRYAMDLIFKNLNHNEELYDIEWEIKKENLKSRVRFGFEMLLAQAFRKYQENMLVSVDDKFNFLGKANLLKEIMREKPPKSNLEEYFFELDNGRECKIPNWEYDKERKKYIGLYLVRLAKLKGYTPLENISGKSLEEYFSEKESEGFKSADYLDWKVTSSQVV